MGCSEICKRVSTPHQKLNFSMGVFSGKREKVSNSFMKTDQA
jgi:hypothetical protein